MITYRLYTTNETENKDSELYPTLLSAVKKKHGINYEIVDLDTLNEAEKEKLVENIRIISSWLV